MITASSPWPAFTDAIALENGVLQRGGSRQMRGAFATLASLAEGGTGDNDISGGDKRINWRDLADAVTSRKERLEHLVTTGKAPAAPEFWRHLSTLRRMIIKLEVMAEINEKLTDRAKSDEGSREARTNKGN